MKTVKVKTPRKVTPKKIGKAKPVTPKLSKSDPDFYSKIGEISAQRRALDPSYFSKMAKKSHGPKSKRDGYHGGRRKKTDDA